MATTIAMLNNPESFQGSTSEGAVEVNSQQTETEPAQEKAVDITETLGEIEMVSQEMAAAKKSIAETEAKMAELRGGMNLPPGGEPSPAAEYQEERIARLEKRQEELQEQRSKWLGEFGRDELPDGVAMDAENGDREAKGGSGEDEETDENEEKDEGEAKEKEDLENRRRWFAKWTQETVKNFENAIRNDWRAKDAVNLELAIQLMRVRVPVTMTSKAEDFLNGNADDPPFTSVWIRWETQSPLDQAMGNPNQIYKVDITFDNQTEQLTGNAELKGNVPSQGSKESQAQVK